MDLQAEVLIVLPGPRHAVSIVRAQRQMKTQQRVDLYNLTEMRYKPCV